MLWAGQDFAARSRCDLDLQDRDPNVARDTLPQHGDHFRKIVSKFDFKKQSYGPDTNGTYGRTDGRTDERTRRRLYVPPKFFGEHRNLKNTKIFFF